MRIAVHRKIFHRFHDSAVRKSNIEWNFISGVVASFVAGVLQVSCADVN
jgi:hypothetical protein